MKLPPRCIRILFQLFCLLGIMPCQALQPETAPSTNQGKPDPVSTNGMKSMHHAGDKI
jgi:hypothetical protein